MTGIPYVAIGAGEQAPWAHLPLTCPTCEAGPLPLLHGTRSDGTPSTLTYIKHCGSAWVRGPIRNEGA